MSSNGFLQKFSIKSRLILLSIITSIVFVILIPLLNGWQISNKLYEQKKVLITGMVTTAHNIANEYYRLYQSGELTLEESQARAKVAISKITYGANNYVWVNNYNSIILLHPKSKYLGKDFKEVTDKKGKKFVLEGTVKAVTEGSAYIDYFFEKPGADSDTAYPKLSYMKSFPGWKWVIGTGEYVDDIQNEIIKTTVYNVVYNIVLFIVILLTVNMPISSIIISPVSRLIKLSNRLAEHDLSIDIEKDNNKTEIGELNRSYKKFIENFKSLIMEVSNASSNISSSTQEMSASIEDTANGSQTITTGVDHLTSGAQEQAKSVMDSLENVNSINRKVQRIYSGAEETVNLSKTTEQNALNGREQAGLAVIKINQIKHSSLETSKTINELGKLGAEIETILELIKTLASQTNLLALNAAIEAARAGEHGKGFAVVADEVKKLAGQSAEATDKIAEMVQEIQTKTSKAVEAMNEGVSEVDEGVVIIENVGHSLDEILNAAKETKQHIEDISGEVSRLSLNSEEVAKMMENISAISEQTVASTEQIADVTKEQSSKLQEISAGAHSLARIAENLQHLVTRFRT